MGKLLVLIVLLMLISCAPSSYLVDNDDLYIRKALVVPNRHYIPRYVSPYYYPPYYFYQQPSVIIIRPDNNKPLVTPSKPQNRRGTRNY